jgi:hypothetical protein
MLLPLRFLLSNSGCRVSRLRWVIFNGGDDEAAGASRSKASW